MKHAILIILLLTGLTVRSQPTFTKAQDYNDYIVAQQTAIGNLILALTATIDTDDEATIKSNFLALQTQAATSLENVKQLDEFNGNTALKSASILLFEFYIDIINNEYAEIIAVLLKEEISNEDYVKINDYLTSITEKEAYYDDLFAAAQKQFAEENGIDLIENELQEEFDELNDE